MERANETLDKVRRNAVKYRQMYQLYMDKSVPFVKERWLGVLALLLTFVLRVVIAHGWYVECYALFIYLLNISLAFLSPRFDPDLQDDLRSDEQEAGLGGLPTTRDDEFKPFVRRLPEFRYWQLALNGTLVALITTLFRTLDIPVFWPILVIYFVMLFVLTMRRQIQHMIKYRYIPFDIGKKRFTSK